ncbi:MAG: hypothetical protein OXB88_06065 [Bacteriovoracales bacterium]|nr:hypothetical protein [Bacteriovoracales bacterium]
MKNLIVIFGLTASISSFAFVGDAFEPEEYPFVDEVYWEDAPLNEYIPGASLHFYEEMVGDDLIWGPIIIFAAEGGGEMGGG